MWSKLSLHCVGSSRALKNQNQVFTSTILNFIIFLGGSLSKNRGGKFVRKVRGRNGSSVKSENSVKLEPQLIIFWGVRLKIGAENLSETLEAETGVR
jgi:hypothetical protein